MPMITITPAAADQIRKSAEINANDGSYLRVAATRGPDGKLQYGLGFDQKGESDALFESEGIEYIVSDLSAPFLEGATIDYVELVPGEKRFIVYNPNDPDHKQVVS